MSYYKITNCTTFTGGGKKPLRKRVNQNISIRIDDEEIVENIGKKIYSFLIRGQKYLTTYESKIIKK
jgi:hypothetical protein